MKAITILAFSAVICSVSAAHGYGYGQQLGGIVGEHADSSISHSYGWAHPRYTYNYGVADKITGDQKSAGESRDGEYVRGYYQLVQPDGVLRTVHYTSSPKLGFQAQVINKGKALHPGGHYGKGGGYYGINNNVGFSAYDDFRGITSDSGIEAAGRGLGSVQGRGLGAIGGIGGRALGGRGVGAIGGTRGLGNGVTLIG